MALKSISIAAVLLSNISVGPTQPWRNIEAGSEQRNPVYIGATPRELEVERVAFKNPVMTESLRRRGERQAQDVYRYLKAEFGHRGIELEGWPVQNEEGERTWAFARWRVLGATEWLWLDHGDFRKKVESFDGMLPDTFASWRKRDVSKVFDDFLTLNSLYDKGFFGECIWTNEAGTHVYSAWLAPSLAKKYREVYTAEDRAGLRPVCHRLPQPARFNESPATVVIRVVAEEVHFPESIQWVSDQLPSPSLPASMAENRVSHWPETFLGSYQQDVQMISGERQAYFPLSERRAWFSRKNSADRGNRLLQVIEYLEERYTQLGIQTRRQQFTWRGIKQYNLIATIPGEAKDAAKRPVLLADHIDTAYSELDFQKTGERISSPGADDNATATAALLKTAETLRHSRPLYDIQLVHFTGEEYPADCLGARYYVSTLLEKGYDIRGLILMDMIGYNDPKHHNQFQINAGESVESLQLARLSQQVAMQITPHMEPVYRARFDERSYLYNTDGIIFSDAGYPVILLNEYINKLENLGRPHYHEQTDLSDKIDWEYATSIVKVAIETAARLAQTSTEVKE